MRGEHILNAASFLAPWAPACGAPPTMSLGPGTSELTPTIVDPPRIAARTATVRAQFERRALRFAAHDFLLREVSRRLLERLDIIRLTPQRILDVGCGTGSAREPLLARFAHARWIGVDIATAMLACAARVSQPLLAQLQSLWRPPRAALVQADAATLPFAPDTIDLVFSNLMLHWHPQPHTVFPEWLRVLRVDGLLIFSCFGPDTLKELRTAYRGAGIEMRPMPFVDMHDFGDMMVAAGLATPVMDVETIRLTYPSPQALLREVAALGGNPRDDRAQALVSGPRARALLDCLDAGRDAQGRIGLSFEIAYGHAWKPPPRARGETSISLEQLRTRLRAG